MQDEKNRTAMKQIVASACETLIRAPDIMQ